ncbi:MAG: GNAT family N-acetyltransferase [Flavobacterium sp.]|nr:GNAT family N-acetyltransferase [Flavobacterium sp.]
MYTCTRITTAETYAVRHPVLRKGKPLSSCAFAGDDLSSTQHFGIFETDKLIGVLSLFVEKCSLFQTENQLQFRGMAVLEPYQNKGIGEQLMRYAELEIKLPTPYLIWLNAREKAISFYTKMGYQNIGEPFIIGDIGTHFVYYKIQTSTPNTK